MPCYVGAKAIQTLLKNKYKQIHLARVLAIS